jgi:hypothetical protein
LSEFFSKKGGVQEQGREERSKKDAVERGSMTKAYTVHDM